MLGGAIRRLAGAKPGVGWRVRLAAASRYTGGRCALTGAGCNRDLQHDSGGSMTGVGKDDRKKGVKCGSFKNQEDKVREERGG